MRLACFILLMALSFSSPFCQDAKSDPVKEDGFRFEIMKGYLKSTMISLMDKSRDELPGGIFNVSISLHCTDPQGNDLGCGIYCDNQWGGNRNEKYYFIPLRFENIGGNHFRLERDLTRKPLTNNGMPTDWADETPEMKVIIDELCDPSGWHIESRTLDETGLSELTLIKAADPEKRLYHSCIPEDFFD